MVKIQFFNHLVHDKHDGAYDRAEMRIHQPPWLIQLDADIYTVADCAEKNAIIATIFNFQQNYILTIIATIAQWLSLLFIR